MDSLPYNAIAAKFNDCSLNLNKIQAYLFRLPALGQTVTISAWMACSILKKLADRDVAILKLLLTTSKRRSDPLKMVVQSIGAT